MTNGRMIRFPEEVGLARGAEGTAVEELQRYLNRFGYLKVPRRCTHLGPGGRFLGQREDRRLRSRHR
jgi:hypothetical protein